MKLRPVHLGIGLFLCVGVLLAVWVLTRTSPTAAALSGAPTDLPATGILDTRCTDALGDTDGVDVSDVALVSQDDQLILAFAFAGPMPTQGILILTIDGRSRDGTQSRQLKVVLNDGQPVAAFVVISPTTTPVRLDDAVHVDNDEVHAAFPADSIAPLGPQWNWFATVGDQNTIGDQCPGTSAAGATAISVG